MATPVFQKGLERILSGGIAGRNIILGPAALITLTMGAALMQDRLSVRDQPEIENGISGIPADSLYLALPANGTSLVVPLSDKEIRAYSSNHGRVSEDPKVLYVGSGGSGKGYWTVGFLNELRMHIEIDHYRVTSVQSFDAVSGKLSPQDYEEFAVEVSDLFEPLVSAMAKRVRVLKYREMLGRLRETEEVTLGDRTIHTPIGLHGTSKLEERLKQIFGQNSRMDTDAGNYTIMAASYDHVDEQGRPKAVELGVQYPEMPVPTAILAAIAIKRMIRFQEYDGHLLGDAGPVSNFPLSGNHLHQFTSVIGVDLGARNFASKSKLPADVAGEVRADHEYNCRQTREIMHHPGIDRLAYVAPYFPGIAPFSLSIPLKMRRDLIAQGKEAALELLRMFRSPTVSINHGNYAA